MAKRQADGQRTKDDSSDDEEVEPGVRDKPLGPVAGRVIRGLPKRSGAGAPASAAPASAAPSKANAFAGFSFGAPPASTPTPSFTFGASTSTPTISSSTAPSAPFTFGSSAVHSSTPAAPAPQKPSANSSFRAPAGGSSFTSLQPATAAASAPADAPPKLFAGFSNSSTPTAAADSTSDSTSASRKPPPSPPKNGSGTVHHSGPIPDFFGVKNKPSQTPEVAAPKPFSFGTSSTSTSSGTPAAPPKPFAGFSFTSAAASSLAPPASPPKASSASATIQSATPAPSVPAGPPSISAANGTKSNQPEPSQATPPPESEVTYYTSLRGLNRSFLAFLQSTYGADNFVDLAAIVPGLLSQYNVHLEDAKKKSGFMPQMFNGEANKVINGNVPAATALKTASSAAPPALPKVGSFALLASASSSSSASSRPGFVPTVASSSAPKSPFTFRVPAKPAEAPKASPSRPSAEVTRLVEDVISGKSDETTVSTPKRKADVGQSILEGKKPAPLFSFAPSGPLHPATPDSKAFAPSSSIEAPASSPPVAKLGKFGPGGSTPQLSFGGAKASPTTPASSAVTKPFSFNFGSGESSTFNLGQEHGPISTTAAPAAPTLPFGSSSSKPAAAPTFSFGSSSTTSGFSFGSKPEGSGSTPAFSFGASAAKSPFTFTPNLSAPLSTNPSSTSITTAAGAGDAEEGGKGEDDAPAPASPGKNLATLAGEGEEDEDTVLEQRGKLYRLQNGKYEVVGLGVFKVKRSKEGGKRRLLLRRDGSGHVILNMAISSNFDPSSEGPQIKFLGFDLEGKPAPYALRVKTADVASGIVKKMKDEVEAIKKE